MLNDNATAKIGKKQFVKPEIQVLDIKSTKTSTVPNPTESLFHFPS